MFLFIFNYFLSRFSLGSVIFIAASNPCQPPFGFNKRLGRKRKARRKEMRFLFMAQRLMISSCAVTAPRTPEDSFVLLRVYHGEKFSVNYFSSCGIIKFSPHSFSQLKAKQIIESTCKLAQKQSTNERKARLVDKRIQFGFYRISSRFLKDGRDSFPHLVYVIHNLINDVYAFYASL